MGSRPTDLALILRFGSLQAAVAADFCCFSTTNNLVLFPLLSFFSPFGRPELLQFWPFSFGRVLVASVPCFERPFGAAPPALWADFGFFQPGRLGWAAAGSAGFWLLLTWMVGGGGWWWRRMSQGPVGGGPGGPATCPRVSTPPLHPVPHPQNPRENPDVGALSLPPNPAPASAP